MWGSYTLLDHLGVTTIDTARDLKDRVEKPDGSWLIDEEDRDIWNAHITFTLRTGNYSPQHAYEDKRRVVVDKDVQTGRDRWDDSDPGVPGERNYVHQVTTTETTDTRTKENSREQKETVDVWGYYDVESSLFVGGTRTPTSDPSGVSGQGLFGTPPQVTLASTGHNEYHFQAAADAPTLADAPTAETQKDDREQSFGERVASGFWNFIDTAQYFGNTYVDYLTTEVTVAGETIIETGRATGDFLGDHASKLYWDPAEEWQRVKTGAANTVAGASALGEYVWNNPGEALSRAGSGTLDYLDQLASNPEASGKLLGNAAAAWATGGVTSGGKQVTSKALGRLWQLGRHLDDVPDAGHAKPTHVDVK